MMTGYEAPVYWCEIDKDFPPSHPTAEKAAAMCVLKASIFIALENASADEIYDVIDATMLKHAH